MKILLSAYACEPNKGSEPEFGWRWSLELARLGHEVWVLTRENNRTSIEAGLARQNPLPNLHCAYYDLPPWARWWKRGQRGVNLYYRLWQWGAYKLARKLHHQHGFDRAHHVTFGTLRHPTFLRRLGVPFVFGPVAGGERVPWRLRRGMGLRGRLIEVVRDVSNLAVRLDPFVRATLCAAEAVYVTSPETRRLVPGSVQEKVRVELGFAINGMADGVRHCGETETADQFKILYVGRFLHWKGVHLGLAAFARTLNSCRNARLTLVGAGPEEQRWRRQAVRLGVADKVDWLQWQNQGRLQQLYREHDLLLFPSLRDSGGMVVLEALSHGLPVVCLDLGGPGVAVDESCGRVIATSGCAETEVVEAMARAMQELWLDSELRGRLSDGARRRVTAFSWSAKTQRIYRSGGTLPRHCEEH